MRYSDAYAAARALMRYAAIRFRRLIYIRMLLMFFMIFVDVDACC